MKRYGYYAIDLSLEVVWDKTLLYFENHKGKIKNQSTSPNGLYRKLRIRHGFSMHLYGTSYGETYKIAFGYNPSDDITYVSVSVKYSNFGKGIPSKIPKDMMKEWANHMGINPMKLGKEVDHDFLAKLDKIKNFSPDQISNLSSIFCSICGERNRKRDTVCVACGSQLET